MKDKAIEQLSKLITSLANGEVVAREFNVRIVDDSYITNLLSGGKVVRRFRPCRKTFTIELEVN